MKILDKETAKSEPQFPELDDPWLSHSQCHNTSISAFYYNFSSPTFSQPLLSFFSHLWHRLDPIQRCLSFCFPTLFLFRETRAQFVITSLPITMPFLYSLISVILVLNAVLCSLFSISISTCVHIIGHFSSWLAHANLALVFFFCQI